MSFPFIVRFIQNVAILFAPGCVVHLRDNRLNLESLLFEAIIKTNRIKTMTQVTKVR